MKRASDDVLPEVLAQCIEMMRAGATVSGCLDRYPEHAAQLGPLLQTVADVGRYRPVPARPPAVIEQRRADFMLAAASAAQTGVAVAGPSGGSAAAGLTAAVAGWWRRITTAPRGGFLGMPRTMPAGLLLALLMVFVLGFAASGIVSAANQALPGDVLFPFKLTLENVRELTLRDPDDRENYAQERAGRRRSEAKTVADMGRSVTSLALSGVIEEIKGSGWRVSALDVLVTPQTVIIGRPAVGSRVSGTMRSPGDHTLVAVYVEIEPATSPPGAAVATATPTEVRPTRVAPTPTPTATPTLEPTRDPGFAPLPAVTAVRSEPTDRPTWTPVPTATAAPTRTPLPTATATSLVTATPTATAMSPDAWPTGRIIGFVKRVEGSWWTIDEVTVECDSDTRFFGSPDVGSKVEAIVAIRPNGSVVGLEIHAIGAPQPTPEPYEFTDVVREATADWWKIGDTTVRVSGDTVYENEPGIGDTVSVKAQNRGGEIWALRIRALRDVEVYFRGTIESMGGDGWVIDGNRVIVDGSTQIGGDPQVGSVVDVAAVRKPDGRLIATRIQVVELPPP